MASLKRRLSRISARETAPYSVTKIEKKAVDIAKSLYGLVRYDESLTQEVKQKIVLYIADKYSVPTERIMAMFNSIDTLTLSKPSLIRIAFAVLHYIPEYIDDDTTLEGPYEGDPPLLVHCKVVGVKGTLVNNRVSLTVKLVFMTSILAGQSLTMTIGAKTAQRILKAIGGVLDRKRIMTYPQELMHMYMYIKLGSTATKKVTPLEYTATSSERRANKKLAKARNTKKCAMTTCCALCSLGIDRCALACRLTTITD